MAYFPLNAKGNLNMEKSSKWKGEIMVKISIVGLSSNQSTSKWWNQQSEIWREWNAHSKLHSELLIESKQEHSNMNCYNVPVGQPSGLIKVLKQTKASYHKAIISNRKTGDLWKPCGSEWLSHGNWWTGCWQSLKTPFTCFSLFWSFLYNQSGSRMIMRHQRTSSDIQNR